MYHLRKTVLLSQSEMQKQFLVLHSVRNRWFPETWSINYVMKFHGMSWSNRCFLLQPLVCCFSYVDTAILQVKSLIWKYRNMTANTGHKEKLVSLTKANINSSFKWNQEQMQPEQIMNYLIKEKNKEIGVGKQMRRKGINNIGAYNTRGWNYHEAIACNVLLIYTLK